MKANAVIQSQALSRAPGVQLKRREDILEHGAGWGKMSRSWLGKQQWQLTQDSEGSRTLTWQLVNLQGTIPSPLNVGGTSVAWSVCWGEGGGKGLAVTPGLVLGLWLAFWSPFPMVGYLDQPWYSGEGRGPAWTWYSRFCWLPKGAFTPSEEWMGVRWENIGAGEGKGGRTRVAVRNKKK